MCATLCDCRTHPLMQLEAGCTRTDIRRDRMSKCRRAHQLQGRIATLGQGRAGCRTRTSRQPMSPPWQPVKAKRPGNTSTQALNQTSSRKRQPRIRAADAAAKARRTSAQTPYTKAWTSCMAPNSSDTWWLAAHSSRRPAARPHVCQRGRFEPCAHRLTVSSQRSARRRLSNAQPLLACCSGQCRAALASTHVGSCPDSVDPSP